MQAKVFFVVGLWRCSPQVESNEPGVGLLFSHPVLRDADGALLGRQRSAPRGGGFCGCGDGFDPAKPRVLLLDELGYLPIDKTGADLLFQIISQRYERGATVITTNRVYRKRPEIFNNDATLTSAVLDRLLHHAETVVIEGKGPDERRQPRIVTPRNTDRKPTTSNPWVCYKFTPLVAMTANLPSKLPRIWPISTRTLLTAEVVRSL